MPPFNRWIDDEWSGDSGVHAALLDAGLADVCAFVPKVGVRVEGCQAYVDTDALKAAQLGIELTKDQALVRLLFKTTDGVVIGQQPKNGDELEFEDRTLTVGSRTRSEDDCWIFVCQM